MRGAARIETKLVAGWVRVGEHMIHTWASRNADWSDGPALVLVHGLGLSARYMLPLAEQLAGLLRVYAPDLPGFGKSSKPPHALDVGQLADVLVRWMDSLGLDRAVLLGNSLGGQVIADVAARYPERVRGGIIVSPTMDPAIRSLWRLTLQWFGPTLRGLFSFAHILLPDLVACGPLRLWRTFRYTQEDQVVQRLPRVQAPFLVICGSQDPMITEEWACSATSLLPAGSLSFVVGEGHVPHYTAPEYVARLVHSYILQELVSEESAGGEMVARQDPEATEQPEQGGGAMQGQEQPEGVTGAGQEQEDGQAEGIGGSKAPERQVAAPESEHRGELQGVLFAGRAAQWR